MIGCAAVQASSSAAHTADDVLIRNFNVDREIDLFIVLSQLLCKYLSLRNGSRETVKDISLLAVGLRDTVNNQVDSQLIRHEVAGIHVGFSLFAKFCAVLDVGTENVSCRDVGNPILLRDHLSLCAFACSGCSQHNDLHCNLHF